RERARNIRDDFLRLLEPYETLNHILYSEWIGFSVFVLTIIAFFPLIEKFSLFYKKYSISLLFLIYPAHKIARILKPYSTFDTKQNARMAKIANWILLAICSAIIGVIVRAIVALV